MYSSQTFGRWFWLDDNYEFKSCPLNVDGTGDFTCEDYGYAEVRHGNCVLGSYTNGG